MKKKGFTAEQIIGKLREAEVLLGQGSTVGEVSRKLGITEQTYYRWRPNYLLVNEYTNSTNVKNNLDPDDMVTDLSPSLLSLWEDILSAFDS